MIASFDPRMVMNLLAMRKARRLGIPFIWWGHGVRPRGRFASFYKRLVDKASAVIVYDGEGKERLVRLGVSPNKVFVAWNSVDTAEIARLRQPYHADDRSDVLYIGRLVASKKVDLLLRGFSLFAASGMSPEVRLTVLGSGPEETALKSLAESLGIAQNTEFIPGMYEQSQIAPYFNRSVVHACGGYVGLSVIQSLAFGVPVVAPSGEPHSPEIAALEDRVNSRFFARDSADDLAQVLTDCFADRAGLDRQSAAGIKKVSGQFSVEAMAATFVVAVDFVKGCAV
jgi:glycosyltransferase involved in cell wall biosynthesis